MIQFPFEILRQFEPQIFVGMLSKKDDAVSDDDLAKKLNESNVPNNGIASLWQVHGKHSVVIQKTTSRQIQADGLMTKEQNLILDIRWADCQNFLVYSPIQNVIGLMHVGWRGLNEGMIFSFFEMLQNKWGVDPTHVFVVAGPSLCKKCAEFTDPSKELSNISSDYFDGRHVDLHAAAEAQLAQCKVNANKFERYLDCPSCNPSTWWSYRGGDKEAVKNGHTNHLICCLR